MITLFTALALGIAGGLGSSLRYLVDSAVAARLGTSYPWGITVVNLSGSFTVGVVAGLATWAIPDGWAALASVGLLGGYTTFSTASLDLVRMLRDRRFGSALLYGFGTLVLGIALAWLGYLIAS